MFPAREETGNRLRICFQPERRGDWEQAKNMFSAREENGNRLRICFQPERRLGTG